jgi:2-oxoglutarate dehydrogenase E2 component (dihydrolipoamide succinyltransferase)
MGESITEGTLTKWLKKVGDKVERDEPLFEISTDKVDAEIPSPAAGTLQEIKITEGATVQINTVVCIIAEGAGAVAAPPVKATPAPAAATPATAPAAAPIATLVAVPTLAPTSGAGTDVPMPQMGESITEGTITKWLKKVGDKVERDEPLFEISTDKVDAEIPSPAAGTLTEIKFPEGSTVGINTVVAVIGGGAGKPVAAPAPAASSTSAPAPVAPTPMAPVASAASGERPRSSPLVRKIAKDNNVDLGRVPATGPSGRITKTDILGYIENPAAKPAPAAAPAMASAATSAAGAPIPGSLVPMTKMRSIIARRMVESKQTSPHVHSVFKVDMTRIVRLREREKSKYEQRNGVKLTYMPFITRAAIVALRKHPIVNATIEGDAIRYNRNINIGIAVALEWGLIVPVIKQAEEKNFLGIARAIADVAGRARGKKLAPDEVSGGTFTLTNSGIFGEQFGMPIINQPQAAILGIGGLNKEAAVLTDKEGNDSIAIRSIQRFALGFDHRIVDGADAGRFMADFKAYLENWDETIG